VYVDGFNFYYAAFRRGRFAPYKWLDPVALCEAALPRNDIGLVRYFTAPLNASRGRAAQCARQETYLAALRTRPRRVIHYGDFVEHAKVQRLVHPQPRGSRTAEVWVPEEKGSDVNLASYLLLDSFRRECDVAVVISNDADLLEPVRIAREDLGQTVGVLRVEGGQRRCIFAGRVDFIRPLRRGHFAAAQLPAVVRGASGREYHRPAEWDS
jgi:hypothetical protein